MGERIGSLPTLTLNRSGPAQSSQAGAVGVFEATLQDAQKQSSQSVLAVINATKSTVTIKSGAGGRTIAQNFPLDNINIQHGPGLTAVKYSAPSQAAPVDPRLQQMRAMSESNAAVDRHVANREWPQNFDKF